MDKSFITLFYLLFGICTIMNISMQLIRTVFKTTSIIYSYLQTNLQSSFSSSQFTFNELKTFLIETYSRLNMTVSLEYWNLFIRKIMNRLFCNGIYVDGSINGKPCKMLIDTGSAVTLVSADRILDAVTHPGSGSSVTDNFPDLRTVSGESMTKCIIGKSFCEIQIGNLKTLQEVFIARIMDTCIVGLDFLIKNECTTNLSKSILQIKDHEDVPINMGLTDFWKDHIPCNKTSHSDSAEKLQNLHARSSVYLSTEEREKLKRLISKFEKSFSKDEEIMGQCNVTTHRINTGEHSPIKQAPRRLPFHRRQEVQLLLKKMRKQGIIEKSSSPWASPIVLVKKKDGTSRFCVDYRKLNKITKKDSQPLPKIEELLDALTGFTWFSTIDLQSGYWQVVVDEEDREKTAFAVGTELWQFKVMPFGLCNAPATFQRLMETILEGELWRTCLVYLDDIIIFGRSFEDMMHNLETIFTKLREANLLMNPKKCTFFQRQVTYLGHKVSQEGIHVNPEKVSAIMDWPIPRNKKQLKSFLGLCSYYRRFVKGFATLAKPLHQLTENKEPFIWTEACQHAVDVLKEKLTTSPILAYPLESEEFILDTDASNVGIGAVLSQIQNGEEKVIAYFSKVLSKPEKNYCVTRKELLAIIKSVEHFHHYLYGKKFTVRTDHASLRWLLSFKNPEGQMARWIECLQQYHFEIIHRPGNQHANADGLSRIPCNLCRHCNKKNKEEEEKSNDNKYEKENIEEEKLEEHKVCRVQVFDDGENWKKEQMMDPDIKIIYEYKMKKHCPTKEELSIFNKTVKLYWSISDSLYIRNKLLFRRWESPNGTKTIWQLIVPRQKVNKILQEAHNSTTGGHFGVNKTLAKIRERFYWMNCKNDVEDWCRNCKICTSKKGPKQKRRGKMQIYNVGVPFERIAVDILGPLPKSFSGNRFLLVVADYFTKWPEVIPLQDYQAKTIATALVNEIFSRYGVPVEIHSDQGRSFQSKIFQEVMKLLNIKTTRTTPLHPQSDGLVERLNRTILQYLSMFVSKHQRDWDELIPMFLLSYRTSEHDIIKQTPSMMMMGRQLRLPMDLYRGFPPDNNKETVTEYTSRLKRNLEKVHDFARKRLSTTSKKIKMRYDVGTTNLLFNIGDKVWLYQPRRTKGKCPKLQSDWEGPYIIEDRINDVVYRIRKNTRSKCKVVHINRLAKYHC